MSVDIDFLSRVYFAFDEPIPYKLKEGQITISPILLKNSELFLSCYDILGIDKNSMPDARIIQMSYLQFICEILFCDEKAGSVYSTKLGFILENCLGLRMAQVYSPDGRRYFIKDYEQNVTISAKEFDDIRKIILYQNFPKYDDSYINPDLKKAMEEEDAVRNKGIDSPNLERRMAIITSHCGISKKEQMEMTYRSHNMLFEEVVGEVEFTTVRNAALIGGGADKLEHWIFKKKKDKFDGYITSVDTFAKKMGGSGQVKTVEGTSEGKYLQNLNNFN